MNVLTIQWVYIRNTIIISVWPQSKECIKDCHFLSAMCYLSKGFSSPAPQSWRQNRSVKYILLLNAHLTLQQRERSELKTVITCDLCDLELYKMAQWDTGIQFTGKVMSLGYCRSRHLGCSTKHWACTI